MTSTSFCRKSSARQAGGKCEEPENGTFNRPDLRTSHFKRTSTCNRRCHTCTYCDDLARDLLGYGWVTRENLEDLGRYGTIAAIEARFGGRYPRCPAFAERPTETPTETRRNHDTADQNLARA